MPRVGNGIWSNWTNIIFPKDQFIRIVNQNDFTPHLPPEISGFEHSGSEVWISNFTHTYSCLSSKLETNECSNSINFSWDIRKHGEAWGQIIGHKSCYKNILFLQQS